MSDVALHTISLCSGAGGIELGLKLALGDHVRTVCYVERDGYAAATLVARMEDQTLDQAPVWSDLATFSGKAWRGKVDLITAGYPCQPFSSAGHRRGETDPRHLWPHVLRVFVDSGASLLFCENVSGHLHIGFSQVVADLQAVGCHVASGIFTAEECGAPHQRERLFFLAYSDRVQLRNTRRQAIAGNDGAKRATGTVLASSPERRRRLLAEKAKPLADDDRNTIEEIRLRRLWRKSNDHGLGAATFWQATGIPEPIVQRVDDGMASWMDRFRICGNGVVPQVAARAFACLASELMKEQAC